MSTFGATETCEWDAAVAQPQRIGYAPAAEVFKEAVSRGVRVKQVLLEKKILTEEELAAAMTPEALLGPLE